MNDAPKTRASVFTVLSILLPMVGGGLWWFSEKHPHLGDGLNGYAGMFIYLALLGVSALLVFRSFVCGIVAFIRRERWRILALLALLLDLSGFMVLKHGF